MELMLERREDRRILAGHEPPGRERGPEPRGLLGSRLAPDWPTWRKMLPQHLDELTSGR